MSSSTFEFDVFLSHSSHDKPTVRKLIQRLRDKGVKVWFDEDQITPGDSIPLAVQSGLRVSRNLILAWSKNFAESDWGDFESNTFLFRDPSNKKGRKLIPVRIDDAEIEESLAQFAYVDWRQEDETQFMNLLAVCRPAQSGLKTEEDDQKSSAKTNPTPKSEPGKDTQTQLPDENTARPVFTLTPAEGINRASRTHDNPHVGFGSLIFAPLNVAADLLKQRLLSTLINGDISSRISFQPCTGSFGELVGVIEVEQAATVSFAEAVLKESLSITNRRYLSRGPGEKPRLELKAIIPPDVKPTTWNQLTAPPTHFIVAIQDTLDESQADQQTILSLASETPIVALVMKGGGIRGLAYVGALEVLLEHYTFDRYVGTSAGAITALLLAAGYTTDELKGILETKDFRDFFDAPLWKKPWNLIVHRGLNHATSFTRWIDRLLAEKLNSPTQVTLEDIGNHGTRVTVFASRKGKSKLKFDSETDTDGTAASYAARCSMSIPLAFVPQTHQGFLTFDGGLQQNYPVAALLEEDPNANFLGMYLGPEIFELKDTTWQFLELLSIWTESHDAEFLRKYPDQTVIIDPSPIGTLDFELSPKEKSYLLLCGRVGALRFLEKGSERHQAAVKDRDAQRIVVERIRKWRSWQNRLKLLLCGATLAVSAWLIYRYVPQLYDSYSARTQTDTPDEPGPPPVVDTVGGPGKFPDLSLIAGLPDEEQVVNHVPRQKRELITLECVNHTGVDLSLFILDCSAHYRNPQENKWIARPFLASGENYVQLLSNESTGYYAVVVREPIYSFPTGNDAFVGAWDLLESKEVRLNVTQTNGQFLGEVVFAQK